ncbi:amino acid ABC transporter permease [Actinotignum urinale]|uniref:amino acid ABC transporter permease n=1 Tax=Actinotignum urinale TaxID=190146 RepID=UPI0003B4D00D|nr:ABC transporter permease subunit [Actinotignum urinale]
MQALVFNSVATVFPENIAESVKSVLWNIGVHGPAGTLSNASSNEVIRFVTDGDNPMRSKQSPGWELLLDQNTILRLLEGLWVSVEIALISMVLSIIFGLLLGTWRVNGGKISNIIGRVYLEFIRIMPPLVLLFLVYFDLTRTAGINLDGQVAAVIVFTLWGSAEMSDLVRGALTSIPAHQFQSARALGMNRRQELRYVILPQAVRQLLPQTVNLVTRMIKTTSLVVLIGVVEVLKVGQQIIDANRFTHPDAGLWIYGAIFFLYFIVCFPISYASRRLEKRWAL